MADSIFCDYATEVEPKFEKRLQNALQSRDVDQDGGKSDFYDVQSKLLDEQIKVRKFNIETL